MKTNRIFLIIFIAVPILFFIQFYFFSPEPEEKEINWTENFEKGNKDPFGTYLFYELLQNYNAPQQTVLINKPIKEVIKLDANDISNYVFIGGQLYLTQSDIDTLLIYAEKGNTVFIASKVFPEELMNSLFHSRCSEWVGNYKKMDSLVTLNFSHPHLATPQGYTFRSPKWNALTKQSSYAWDGINGEYFCDSIFTLIDLGDATSSSGEKYVNFLKMPYGKGSFIFHTNPSVFANYYLINVEGRQYAEKAMSHLNKGTIYWDEFGKLPYSDDTTKSSNPLKLILGNKSLRTAWYLTLILIVLYILFLAKRKQRPIPILEPNINTSLEFLKTIGTLYFQQNNHRKLMRLKMRLFMNFIRHKYHIPTNVLDDELLRKISLKSNVQMENIQTIFSEAKIINRYDLQVTTDDVIKLHKALDFFYKNCK